MLAVCHRANRLWIDLSDSTKTQTFLFTAKKSFVALRIPKDKEKNNVPRAIKVGYF